MNMKQTLTTLIYTFAGLIGVAAFTYPFLLPGLAPRAAEATTVRASEAPLLTLMLLVLCLAVLLLEVQGQAVSAKMVAALGVLVAATSTLRFIEVAIPGPGGFSPMFAPIILAGYVFGARFGFLMGTLTLLVSALITGGVGPWLPYQMFAAGWVGLTAGWLPRLPRQRAELALLAAFGFAWGLLYGAILNLYFWPVLSGGAAGALGWEPEAGLGAGLLRYGAFYATTSMVWDLLRGVGNVLFIAVLGLPAIRALSRFRERFQFQVRLS